MKSVPPSCQLNSDLTPSLSPSPSSSSSTSTIRPPAPAPTKRPTPSIMPAPNYNLVESQNLDLPILLKPEECHGRTFIVTGANAGLGYECAKRLVLLQSARVIITVRDLAKGEATKAKIEAEAQRQNVIKVYHLDLTSFDNVRAFVNKVETEVDRVDGVIANAGTSNGVWMENEGMEGNLTVNLFSNLLLLALTQPYLKSMRDKFGITPYFTFVGSMGPFVAPKSPLLEVNRDDIFGDLNDKEKRGKREMSLLYCQPAVDF